MIIIGVVLYIGELRWRRKQPDSGSQEPEHAAETPAETGQKEDGECCGLHLVCEKDSLSPMSAEIIYYDDEELDRFRGRDANSYTPAEEEEFREVLMTLRPRDIAGWARSITARRIDLPPDVRDELFLLINDQRSPSR